MRSRPRSVVVVGCSTGGLRALSTMLPGLSPDLMAAIIVVCHAAGEDVELLCGLLRKISVLPVREAMERHAPEPGVVHVAPSGYHLLIDSDGRFIISIDRKVCHVRPSIDVLFESAADVYRSELLAVVLTGANEDGAAGLAHVRRRGGYGIVQSPDEATAPDMPAAAIEAAGADEIVPLREIGQRINHLCMG